MISFSQTGGTSGITQITISATSTQELADVVNHYTLGNESTSLDMPVVQKAYVPVQKYITMSPSAITWSSSNNTGSITINSNDSWVVVSDGWIQVSRMYESDISERYNSVSGNGNTIIGISCFENIGDARIGGITAYCQSNSAISATTTVSQAGGYVKPYITLGTYSMQVSGGSVTTAVTVQSNVSWTATTDSNWVTLNTLTGSGNGNVSFTVSANTSSIERRATITVFNGEINAVLVLTQAASLSRPYIILSPNSFSVPYEGSTGNTISVSANCDYDIEADANWITVNAVSGSGNGSVSFSTSAMTGSSVGNIVFSNSAITEYATVETAFIPYLSANTNNILSSSTGGTFEVSVYSNVNWSVSVDMGEGEVQDSWLSVIPSSGSNNGSITISVDSGLTEASGSVVISNSIYGLSWSIDIEREEYVDRSKIFYTTDTGEAILIASSGWNENVISNVYEGEYGVITFDSDVTKIANTGFEQHSQSMHLTSIEIPSTVTEIGNNAFGNCSKLYYIEIPNSVTTVGTSVFFGAQLTGITIGSGLTEISQFMFYNCSRLRNIEIPSNVTVIGLYAFDGCDFLTGATIHSVYISGYSFYNCTRLSVLNLGNEVQEIGMNTFYHCTGLTEIYSSATTEPQITTGSDRPTFNGISSTGTLHYPIGSDYSTWIAALPTGWTAVSDIVPSGDYLAISPSSFTVESSGSTGNQIAIMSNVSYNITTNVDWIILSDSSGTGNKAITFSTNSTTSTSETNGTITISDGSITRTVSVTRNAYNPISPKTIYYTSTGNTVVTPYVTTGWGGSIVSNTYESNQGVMTFNTVTNVPYNAYSNKRDLKTIILADDITAINGQAFIYCNKLESITIGSKVTSLANYVLYGCSGLTEIKCYSTTAPTLGTGVFGVASSGTLHYPSGSDYSTWISALPSGWTAVADL